MLTDELKAAYRYWARPGKDGSGNGTLALPATRALELARADVAAGVRRYPDPVKPYAAVCWQPGKPGVAHVQNVQGAGLRFVGRVTPESYGGRDRWDKSGETGWYTDPFSEGWNLCFGVVYQLPSRNGKARFVAGYDMADDEAGLTLDFGTIYESDTDSDYYSSNRFNGDGTKDAAYAADELARRAAESEREYQTAWQAGSQYAARGELIADERKAALQLLAERRKARDNGANYPAICAAVTGHILNHINAIAEARRAREALRTGNDTSGHASLYWYTSDSDLRAAFNDGAGEAVLS
jgi:hypothetical protein